MKIILIIVIYLLGFSYAFAQNLNKLDASTIYKKALPSVVLITSSNSKGQIANGSGVILTSDGVVATNYHVIEGAESASVKLNNGDIYDDVQILDTDERKDIAILKIKAINLPTLSVSDSDKIQVGETIYTLGAPRGLTGTISSGIVSSLRSGNEIESSLSGFKIIQFTAPVSPGSSGGALINETGELIGLVFANRPDGQNLNLAIPVNYVTPLAFNKNPQIKNLRKMTTSSQTANNVNADDLPGTYSGQWASNSYPVSGSIVLIITKTNGAYQATAYFTGSDYFSKDDFKTTFTKISEGVFRMDYKGIKTKLSGTGLFTNGRFDGDYRFRTFIWVDKGRWMLIKN